MGSVKDEGDVLVVEMTVEEALGKRAYVRLPDGEYKAGYEWFNTISEVLRNTAWGIIWKIKPELCKKYMGTKMTKVSGTGTIRIEYHKEGLE